MKKLLNLKLILLFTFGLFALGMFGLPSLQQPVSAQCCPGSPGCSGTCQGCRVSPPGGPGCYLNSNGCTSCPPPPPPPPACSNTGPGAATPVAPANFSVDVDVPVLFQWTDGTGWGTNCSGNSNSYTIFAKVKTGGSCAAGTYTNYGAVIASVKQLSVSNLAWGTTYCWLVHKSNGAVATNSAVFEFTTTAPPVISNVQLINANKCGGVQISGRPDNANTNNPLTISMDVSDSHNNFAGGKNVFDSVRIAVITDAQQSAAAVPFTVLDPMLATTAPNAGGLGFKATPVRPNSNFSSVNTAIAPYFGATKNSGDLTNSSGSASLLSLNNASTITQLNNNTMRVTWQVRFETPFPTAADNIYAAVVSVTPSGNLVSNAATSGGVNALQYGKVLTWKTDMQAPTASVSQPTAVNTNTFTIKWTANDASSGNNGIRDLRSYCYVDSNPTSIIDQTVGQGISLGATQLKYPDPANCLITTGNLGTHTYTLNSLSNTSDTHFDLYAEDGACNSSALSSQLDSPSAWIVTAHGVTSAKGGYTNFKIRNIASLAGIVPGLDKDAYLSTYGAMSGNVNIVTQLQSQKNFYVTNYDDAGVLPPEISGETKWFDYLYQLAAARQQLTTSAIATISGKFSSAFGVSAGSNVYRYVNSSIAVSSGTICDVNGAIFVSGDLTLDPDFTKSQTYYGCVFIVKGNVTIGTGQPKTTGAGTTLPSKYDVVEAAIITDGNFNTSADQLSGGVSSWSTGANGTARGYHSAVSYGDKMYVFGGRNASTLFNSVAIYDPNTKIWTAGAAGATTRYRHTAVVYNGKMYVWGGYTAAPLNTMYAYDFAANTWALVTPTSGTSTARYGHTAVVYNNKMYVWGGQTAAAAVNTMDVFDFATNSWSVGKAGGTASVGAVAQVVGNKMYVWGGSATNSSSVYDFVLNAWTAGTTAGSTRSTAASVIYNNKFVIWGGQTPASSAVDILDIATNSWSYGVTGGTARYGHTTVSMNGKMYGFGGLDTAGTYLSSVDVYDYGSPTAGDGLYIHGSVYSATLQLLRNLGIAQNSLQPSEVFDYDPTYARIFRGLLGIRTFSLRSQ